MKDLVKQVNKLLFDDEQLVVTQPVKGHYCLHMRCNGLPVANGSAIRIAQVLVKMYNAGTIYI